LDDFKSVNDTLGHEVGDSLLQQVAQRIAGAVGSSGWVARLGGDEFVAVLCTGAPMAADTYSQARDLGTRLMEVLEVPYSISAHDMRITCCVGAALCAGDTTPATGLLKQADIALHEAKQTGRSTLRVFDPDMQSRVTERVELESELYKALERGQFELHYQVQVDDCARAIGAEALLRWRHPERGLVSPGHFMALAEASGAIVPIGRWVLDVACAQLRAWQDDVRMRELTLAVNVSSRQIQQSDFAEQVRHALRLHGADGRRLKLELTETMLQFDVGCTIGIMRELKREGVQFSLDDFGTGYSSLQYLKQLPLDQLKIDQSFVRDIVTDPNDRAIVATVVAMAASLQVDVIAEGVETPEQLTVLRSLDCSRFQGYLFGRPLAADAFRNGL
jgi:diguanylate cyclase (GGDEF)-like protein